MTARYNIAVKDKQGDNTMTSNFLRRLAEPTGGNNNEGQPRNRNQRVSILSFNTFYLVVNLVFFGVWHQFHQLSEIMFLSLLYLGLLDFLGRGYGPS